MAALITSAVANGRFVRVVTYRDGETSLSDCAASLIFRTAEDARRAAKLLSRLGDPRLFCVLCDAAVEQESEARWHMKDAHSGPLAAWEGREFGGGEADINALIRHWFDEGGCL